MKSLKKTNINQTQWSNLYKCSKTKGSPEDAIDNLNCLDVSLSSLFLSRIVKPVGGWVPGTLSAINYMRTVKNTIYSHADKCWISDKNYADLEKKITDSVDTLLKDKVIQFEEAFKSTIEEWLGKSKELMTSRDNVLQYLQVSNIVYTFTIYKGFQVQQQECTISFKSLKNTSSFLRMT